MSDTSPRDQSALLWNAKPGQVRRPRDGELLFEFTRSSYRYRVELRDHGQWGVDAQFVCDGHLHFSRMFPTRELAILWAEHERDAEGRLITAARSIAKDSSQADITNEHRSAFAAGLLRLVEALGSTLPSRA
jgi:hypothetical protein